MSISVALVEFVFIIILSCRATTGDRPYISAITHFGRR